jgi:hypothetical protein
MGLDPAFFLMKDGSDGEVGFEIFEGFFDGDELDVVLPEGRGVALGKIGTQQIAAFAAADLAQLVSVEGEGEGGRGFLDLDVDEAPSDRGPWRGRPRVSSAVARGWSSSRRVRGGAATAISAAAGASPAP